MFKQTSTSENTSSTSTRIIENLGAITAEQQSQFAALTGRFDAKFKIGKPSDVVIGKSVD